MLKNNSKLGVSVAINYSIKLGFVPVNDVRETYFVDALGSIHSTIRRYRVKGKLVPSF